MTQTDKNHTKGLDEKIKNGSYSAFRMTAARSLERVSVRFPLKSDMKPEQALVKFEAATICGSDMPKWNGTEWSAYPTEPGLPLHECVGEVVISNSASLKPGDRVLAMPLNDLGLQEFFLTDSAQALVLDNEISASAAALIQPLATAIYAIERLGNVKEKSVLIIGLGSLGHLAAWLLKQGGARISTVDPVGSVLHDEWSLGKQYTSTSTELADSNLDTDFDIVVEVVGHQEQTVVDAIRLVRRRGTVLLMGVPRPGATLELETAFRKNVTLISSVTPPWREYFAKAYGIVKTHHEQLEKLVTHHFAFSDAPAAYETYANRSSGRLKVALVKDLAQKEETAS